MKALLVMLAVILVATAGSAFSAPHGEEVFTGSTGYRFAAINSTGPIMCEFLANGGTAQVVLVSSIDGTGTNPNTARRVWPAGDYASNTLFALRDGQPRPFPTYGDKVDSVYVLMGTATEVIFTWTND